LNHVAFEPALFSHYDMFVAASNQPLVRLEPSVAHDQLLASSSGRFVLALLDLHRELKASIPRAAFDEAEADRAARLAIIERQGREMGELAHRAEMLRNELESLRAAYESAEADRAARLGVIHDQGRQLGESEQARVLLEAETKALRRVFQASEADRAARLKVIEDARQQLQAAALAHATFEEQIETLRAACSTSDTDRAARLEIIAQQRQALESAADTQRSLLAEMERKTAELFESERTVVDLRERIKSLHSRNDALEHLSQRGILQLILDRFRGRG
jgi:chromosome segregation ATPase